MKSQGLGGAEIVVLYGYYEKGGHSFLSPEWCELVRHALREAEGLGMTMAMVLSPGWDFGSPWVPAEERSKVLAPCILDLPGPMSYEGPLPLFKDFGTPRTGLHASLAPVEGRPSDQDEVVAVVGAKLRGEKSVEGGTLVDLTEDFRGGAGRWRVEEGLWRLTAFRLRYTGQQNSMQNNHPRSWVVDHLSETAMRRYADGLTERFGREFGPWLGKTVDSIFADSFEAVPLANSLLWSNDTLAQFRRRKGYDFAKYLPALWWDAGEETRRLRYDLNECLHQVALDACFRPFLEACRRIGVAGRMQPHYRFTEEIVEGAGRAHRAETEVTTARFETVADPRKATVSGARFYSGSIVSAEAYTFLHRERFRSTPEELKRASDAFLRDGVTQFYNHGFLYTEEPEVAPDRDFHAGERISPWSPWWRYLGGLSDYVGRCCGLLRQGRFRADVLIYSPQAQVWAERGLFLAEQRVMRYGDLPKTLLANGYDYDIVNDDLLQHRVEAAQGSLSVSGYRYRAVVLPAVETLPVETMRVLARLAEQGVAVIALDRLPRWSCGMASGVSGDDEVRALAPRLLHLPDYGLKPTAFSPQEAPYERTPELRAGQRRLLDELARVVAPQVRLEGGAQSQGLTFQQREVDGRALYFVPNLQPLRYEGWVWFRDARGWPQWLDALTGEKRLPEEWRERDGGVEVRVSLSPWESCFLAFHAGKPPRRGRRRVERVRRSLLCEGPWRLEAQGVRYPRRQFELVRLQAWNDHPELRHFSGTGVYRTNCRLERTADVMLDLGEVGCVAEILVNGRPAGIRWMQPYVLRVPKEMWRKGDNEIEVRVTNTLLAHVQGMKEMPEIPAELQPRLGKAQPPDERIRAAWERDRAFRPLPVSGLIGPVKLNLFD